ncbi:unnamed protein product [Cylindrotheca closterium]|uniref:Uncharacterized protein n=1 Tax=Cylindrotheca closterium TaxID=2856 RepID=A0AAD2CUJ5_9STRA|nr:unnamed protein product [Cylindrotheca closterium]
MEEYFQATKILMDNTHAAKEQICERTGHALDLTIIVLLIVAVEQMETLAMAIDNLALVSHILATRIKDSRMVEIVIHQDLQTTIKEDQVATTKTTGCFVPDGTVPVEDPGRMPQGGMSSAIEQHAEDQPEQEQNDQYFVRGQFVQLHEQNEIYPPPEELYPPDKSYPPQDDQGYYPYGGVEHYSYEGY